MSDTQRPDYRLINGIPGYTKLPPEWREIVDQLLAYSQELESQLSTGLHLSEESAAKRIVERCAEICEARASVEERHISIQNEARKCAEQIRFEMLGKASRDVELHLFAADSPQRPDRTATKGDRDWVIDLPLHDGRTLFLSVGQAIHDGLRQMFLEEASNHQ